MSSPALQLLQELRARGVTARARGENLSLRPREALDSELLERVRALKVELVQHLAAEPASRIALPVESVLGRPDSWREESIAECRRLLVNAGELIREFARSRWGAVADAWPVEMLSGLYVRDLLAGMEAVLPWDGWSDVRSRLDRQTGPTTIARLWSAYRGLPQATQSEVMLAGDRSQSPPACLLVRPGGRGDA